MKSLQRMVPALLWMGVIVCCGWCFVACTSGECKSDDNCASWEVCTGGQCIKKKENQEKNDVQDSGVSRQCPTYCSKDRDCSFCETRLTCDLTSNTCIDPRQKCPEPCNKDEDCRIPICGTRQFCDPALKKCVESIARCPDKCATDNDCRVGGCGTRLACNIYSKTCVEPKDAKCAPSCTGDDQCKECSGGRKHCSFSYPTSTRGVCRAKGAGQCPTSCTRTSECFVQGCGDKLYCNFLLRKCVAKADACPYNCKSDADCPADKCGSWTKCNSNGRCADTCPRSCKKDGDCAKGCGTRTYCYKYSPTTDGYCREPSKATSCPASCRTSFDCKAKSCGTKAYCNYSTRKCVEAAGLCPSRCKTNADCPASKCGSRTNCRNGYCL